MTLTAVVGRELFFCPHCNATIVRPAGTERTPCPVAELVAEDLRQRESIGLSSEGGYDR